MRSPNENNRMRQGQQNNRRGRNNNRRNNNNNNKPQNMLTKNFDSNGPDVKIRGNAATIAEKYMSLAYDAISAGSRIKAENYFQHAEHYKRIVSVALEQQAEQKAAHEAKQAAQRAAHAEQQAARAEQQAARAEQKAARHEQQSDNDELQKSEQANTQSEPVELNTQPNIFDTSAPSMNNNNNMPIDILSSDTSNQQPEVQEKPKRRTNSSAKPKRKPVLNQASIEPIQANNSAPAEQSDIINNDIAEADNLNNDTADKKPVRKTRTPRAKKPKADIAKQTDTKEKSEEAPKKAIKKATKKVAKPVTDDIAKDIAKDIV